MPKDAEKTAEKKEVIKQNGIKRPEPGSITGKLWDIADAISKSLGRPAPRKAVVDQYMAEVPNANQATANTQYARWVTFHGAADALRAARQEETKKRQESKSSEKTDAQKKREAEREAKAKEKEAAKARREDERKRKAQAVADEKARKAKEREEEKARKAAAKAAEDNKAPAPADAAA